MICLKIRTFVVSATTEVGLLSLTNVLWFAWKFVPLWYQQQRLRAVWIWLAVVICLKIRTFVVSATTLKSSLDLVRGCDLLENSYLCGISNNTVAACFIFYKVVICLKIRTFVVSATTGCCLHIRCCRCDLLENSYLCGISNNFFQSLESYFLLWFAWKFVPLWYQQQRRGILIKISLSCDLLENSYLCGISNNQY